MSWGLWGLEPRIGMPAPLPGNVTFHYHDEQDQGACSSCEGECKSTHTHHEVYPPCVQAVDENGDYVGHLNIDYEKNDDEDDWGADDDEDEDEEYRTVPSMINVHPKYRRQSVATDMFDFAKKFYPELEHSSDKSVLGDLWAEYEENRAYAPTAAIDRDVADDLMRLAMPMRDAYDHPTDEWGNRAYPKDKYGNPDYGDDYDLEELMYGQCAAYAVAHQREHPHLRFGIDWEDVDHTHHEWGDFMADEGMDEDEHPDQVFRRPQHIFTHDNHWAYDASGARPLGKMKRWDDVTLNHTKEEVEGTGYLESGYEPDADYVRKNPPRPPPTHTAAKDGDDDWSSPWANRTEKQWSFPFDRDDTDSDTYTPDNPVIKPPHLYLPTAEVADYRWDRGDFDVGSDPRASDRRLQDVAEKGIQRPLEIATNGTHALLYDGHHRLIRAEEHGIPHLPVRIIHRPEEWWEGVSDMLYNNSLGEVPRASKNLSDWHNANHTASTNGIRNAHIIEADVADDLMRLAGKFGDLPENITFQHHFDGSPSFPDVIDPRMTVRGGSGTVSAHDGDKMIGYMQWRTDNHPRRKGEIREIRVHPDYQRRGVGTAMFDWVTDKIDPDLKHSTNLSDEGRAFADAEDSRPLAQERYEAWRNGQPMPKRFAMAWDHWAPQIKGGCDSGCDHDRMMMGEYSIDHPNGTGPQPGDLLPGIKGRSLLQFTHDTDQHGNPELYVSGIHVDEGHRRDGIAEALMRRMRQDHPDTPINPGFTTDDGQGLLDGLKKRIPEAKDALVPHFGRLAAAIAENLLSSLHGQFHDWWGSGGGTKVDGEESTDDDFITKQIQKMIDAGADIQMPPSVPKQPKDENPLGSWPTIEQFMKEHYPAAHRPGFYMGMEQAQPLIDGEGMFGDPVPDEDPYETGLAAVARHGYDPKEVAAGMLLLHNRAHGARSDLESADIDRLSDITQKRIRMQRTYEQRQQGVTASIVRRDGEDDVVDCPSCLTESLADDYNHGGHCPVCGQFNWEYDEHRHGSLRTAMPAPTPDGITFTPFEAGSKLSVETSKKMKYKPEAFGIRPGVAAHLDGNLVGHIEWYPSDWLHSFHGTNNEVAMIATHDRNLQRHGIATALFDYAKQNVNPDLRHSPVQTGLGSLWSKHEESRHAHRTAAFDPDALHDQARTELGHLNNFLRDGIHSGVDMTTDSIEYHPHAHRIEMTPHWAGEAIGLDSAANFSRRTRARAGQYESVLSRMVSKGPMDTQGGYLPPAHEHLDSARNNFRVELQHGNHFTVPDLSAFSRLWNLTDADALGAVNPRYHYGTGGRTPEARDAYKINCQRCVLALDARHKGYNVEARANFRDLGNSHADEQLKDNHIADWWRDQNGMPGAWIDVEDLPDPSKRPDDGSDIANPKRRERYLRENADALHPKLADNPGPHHWDHMADIMSSWGEGARGLIATTRQRPGGYMRHVIHARVGPGGKIAYDDPQDPTGFADHGAHWREHTAYGLSIYSKDERDEGTSLYDSPIAQIRHRNMKHSPLRFMRVDDKTLAPGAAKYLVDRGTAGPQPITPPRNI